MSRQSPTYEYNAPSFVDFVSSDFLENDGADNFFDVANDTGQSACDQPTEQRTAVNNLEESVENLSIHVKEDILNPGSRYDVVNEAGQSAEQQMVGNLSVYVKEELQTSGSKYVVQHPTASTSSRPWKKCPDFKHAAHYKTKDSENTVENKRKRVDSPVPMHQRTKFISLAEGVQHFQRDTPERFHSRSRKGDTAQQCNRKSVARHVTIPKSPALSSHTRNRPVNYPTREEKEELELDEMKRFKLKAHPVNEKILKCAPTLGKKVEARPPTKIEPFHLTEFKRKVPTPEKVPFMFMARPVPKGLFKHTLGLPEKQEIPATSTSTPSFVRYRMNLLAPVIEESGGEKTIVNNKEVGHLGIVYADFPSTTQVQPFSFEDRDRQLQKKKEEKLKQVLEEERKAREFHAQPVPQFIRKASSVGGNSILPTEVQPFGLHECDSSSKDSVNSKKENEEQSYTPFKARPATVLKQKPFEPKRGGHPLKEITAITLNTERRAEERLEFENRKKLREAEIENMKQMIKEEEEKAAAEEVARLRLEAVHRANPVRKFKALKEMEKKPLTSPKTPKFSDRFKK